jgi:hypothetical protein
MIISMDAFEAYKKYLAIKLHFKQKSYDYFKYNGSVKTDKTKFEVRKDKYFFHKLSKRPNINLELFLVSNLKENPDIWVGDLFESKAHDTYLSAKKNIESLRYTFEREMLQFDSLDDALVVHGGDWPKILTAYRRGEVSAETMVIVMLVIKCFNYWDENISDTVVWPMMKQNIEKYSKFIAKDINIKVYNEIVDKLFT